MILLPFIGMTVAKLVTNAFTGRYFLATVLGLSVLFAYISYVIAWRRSLLGAALALSMLIGFGYAGWRAYADLTRTIQDVLADIRFLESAGHATMPIVCPEVTLFHRMSYYAGRQFADRLIYTADPASAVRYLGHDTIDRGLMALRPWFPLKTVDYSSYIASQPRFLVYGYIGKWTWFTHGAARDAVKLEFLARRGDRVLFLATPTASPAASRLPEAGVLTSGGLPGPAVRYSLSGSSSICKQWMDDRVCRDFE
jgi:hypothetical protein